MQEGSSEVLKSVVRKTLRAYQAYINRTSFANSMVAEMINSESLEG